MPDSLGDGMLSYTSMMALGLLLCQGSIYEKAKILYQLVESNNNSQSTVFRKDEYLSLLVFTMIEFATTNAMQYYLRPHADCNHVDRWHKPQCNGAPFIDYKSEPSIFTVMSQA